MARYNCLTRRGSPKHGTDEGIGVRRNMEEYSSHDAAQRNVDRQQHSTLARVVTASVSSQSLLLFDALVR